MSAGALRLWPLLAALGCGGPPALSAADKRAFQAAHAAIYGGPDPAAPAADRHAHLSGSFAGEALTEAFLAQRRLDRRLLAEQTRMEVEELRYLKVEAAAPGTWGGRSEEGPEHVDLTVNVEWTVSGVVEHAGHAHARTNRYAARYGLRRGPEGLRIVASQLRAQEQVPTGLGGEPWGPDGRPRAEAPALDPFSLLGGAGPEEPRP